MLVEEPALDGEGAAAVRPLASSSPAPVRIFVIQHGIVCKIINFIILFSVGRGSIRSWTPGWRTASFW